MREQNIKSRELELLSPAKNADIGIDAIRHGADAVYIGPESFGARASAGNSIEDIRRLVDFAHIYRARVYATVNTIIFENELLKVERMVKELYKAGVDALIVQDMSLLRLDIPPIELHASTQCDIRSVEKARFLESVGFSQLVLARELTLKEIAEICSSVNIPVETFVHGALCVSYSGRCHASWHHLGRSANRGECAQMCRFKYTLKDADNKVLAADRYLLSLHDLNTSDILPELVGCGVRSFKIEGRLKDSSYVKNIVALYRKRLDEIIAASDGRLGRSSYGVSHPDFTPQADKSFNRGFSHYFIEKRQPADLTSPLTPKSLGEPVRLLSSLNNGDGIAYFDKNNNYIGARVNSIDKNGMPVLFKGEKIGAAHEVRRTFDNLFEKKLSKSSPDRRLALDVELSARCIKGIDERGVSAAVPLFCDIQEGKKDSGKLRGIFAKLGNTPYILTSFKDELPPDAFIPASILTDVRRRLVGALDETARAGYPFHYRRQEKMDAVYPFANAAEPVMVYADNVANSVAAQFYRDHGAVKIEMAKETGKSPSGRHEVLMTCRHCVLRELGRCMRRQKPDFSLPLKLISGRFILNLRFNCDKCEMEVCS